MNRDECVRLAVSRGWKQWGRLRGYPGGNDPEYQCFRFKNYYIWIGHRYVQHVMRGLMADFVADEAAAKEYINETGKRSTTMALFERTDIRWYCNTCWQEGTSSVNGAVPNDLNKIPQIVSDHKAIVDGIMGGVPCEGDLRRQVQPKKRKRVKKESGPELPDQGSITISTENSNGRRRDSDAENREGGSGSEEAEAGKHEPAPGADEQHGSR